MMAYEVLKKERAIPVSGREPVREAAPAMRAVPGTGPAGAGMGAQLDEQMQAKMQRFMDKQIPVAEREADELAAGVTARTPQEVKAQLGARMGADFSQVRFHTGADAAGKAESMGARAYATGRDVYFGEGGFDPAVAAHELVHTAQQGAVDSGAQTVSAPMGGVQMMPKFLSAFGRGMGNAWRGIKKAATGVKEFVGGKLGLLGPSREEQRAAAARAENGDYSQTARMRKADVQRLVELKKQTIGATLDHAGPDDIVRMFGKNATASLNPITRKAMSQMARQGDVSDANKQKLREAMEAMDTRMMVDTMRVPSAQDRARLVSHYVNMDDQKRLADEYALSSAGKTYLGSEGDGTLRGAEAARDATLRAVASGATRSQDEAEAMADADLARSRNAGDAMLRTMLLMQLGDFQRRDTTGEGSEKVTTYREWDQTMANAFSHGGRTAFVFGATDQGGQQLGTDAVADALFGADMGRAAGVHTRAAGTHHISTPQAGAGLEGYKEKGGIGAAISSMRDSAYQHYGMDMAIGGVGKPGTMGPGGQAQMINADGRSGHMYIGKKSSTDTAKGGLLMGLESDSPYRMNQTGHMHNAAAVAEEGSSTGGLKTDIQGDKYGGRTVNLSGLRNDELVNILNRFSAHVDALRGGDDEQKARYDLLISQVAGRRMGAQELFDLLDSFMGDTALVEDLLTRARMPGRA